MNGLFESCVDLRLFTYGGIYDNVVSLQNFKALRTWVSSWVVDLTGRLCNKFCSEPHHQNMAVSFLRAFCLMTSFYVSLRGKVGPDSHGRDAVGDRVISLSLREVTSYISFLAALIMFVSIWASRHVVHNWPTKSKRRKN